MLCDIVALKKIMPTLPIPKAQEYIPLLQAAMKEFAINNALRQAAFLAQLAHESCELRYMEEIASGSAYEGRKDLGNIQLGDGVRYKGRGPIQLTGRTNYQKTGKALGLDLEGHPELVATPEVGFRIAGWFWAEHGLNGLADMGEAHFPEITRRINGGQNGSLQRWHYYTVARQSLGC